MCRRTTFITPVKATTVQTQFTGVRKFNKQVQYCADTADKQTQISTAPVSIDLIKDSDKLIKQYTGLNDYTLFVIIHRYLTSKCEDEN